jgi:uncharacterized membrane protein
MALLDTARQHCRPVVAAGAVASVLTLFVPVPVAADEPSPAPIDVHPTPADMIDIEAGDRRPAGEAATTGDLLLRKGRFRTLPDAPGAAVTLHAGINDRGQTVGIYIDEGAVPNPDGLFPPEAAHGFVYTPSRHRDRRFTTIDIPGARYALPRDINDRGQIVGGYIDQGAVPGPDGSPPPGAQHVFLWDQGRVTLIDPPDTAAYPNAYKINDRGQIVGSRYLADGTQLGYLRQPDGTYVTLDPPGGAQSKGLGINDRGQVVGGYLDDGAVPGPDGLVPPGTIHAFRWDDGRYTRLDDAPDTRSTVAHGIDNRGRIVGEVKDAAGRIGGFLRTRGRYSLIDGPGDRSDTIATDINNRGDILIPAPGTVDALGNSVA